MSRFDVKAGSDPFALFGEWFAEARRVEANEPHAMVLATVEGATGTSARGGYRVSSRVVLLKDWDREGFVFFTNYGSRKARAMEENPCASLLFHWRILGRQVRIEGSVARASAEVSDAYFASRPLGARLGAWSSRQSEVLESREMLEDRIASEEKRWTKSEENPRGEISRPAFWGGYVLRAERLEFWKDGGEERLHDRFVFEEGNEGEFSCCRLYP